MGLFDRILGGKKAEPASSENTADHWFDQGIILGKAGRHDEATECFEKAKALKLDKGPIKFAIPIKNYALYYPIISDILGMMDVKLIGNRHSAYCTRCGVQFRKEALEMLCVAQVFKHHDSETIVKGESKQGNNFRAGRCPNCGHSEMVITVEVQGIEEAHEKNIPPNVHHIWIRSSDHPMNELPLEFVKEYERELNSRVHSSTNSEICRIEGTKEVIITDVFKSIRSLDIIAAFNIVSKLNAINTKDPLCLFLKGTLAYAIKSDNLALQSFQESLEVEPLFAEVPYYIGQILVESAIDNFKKVNPGKSFTAKMALDLAGTYHKTLYYFALAEIISEQLGLESISAHLSIYKNLLGIWDFTTIKNQPSFKVPLLEDEYTTLNEWFSKIGLSYATCQFNTPDEVLTKIVDLDSQFDALYLITMSNFRSHMIKVLSKQKKVNIFQVGPATPDYIIRNKISSIHSHTIILADPRRIAFGDYFSWAPLNVDTFGIVIVNPHLFLSVELLGLLARMRSSNGNIQNIDFSIVHVSK